jgi:excisionase family DNA binding protein
MVRDAAASSPNDIVWLSTKEAARKLGITTRTLYKMIDSGQVPAYKFGRVIRLQDAEVDAFIQRARIEPGALEHLYADGGREDDDGF